MLRVWMVTLVLGGCGSIAAMQTADTAKSRMIGQTKEAVLGCMGPPDSKQAEGATEVWAYGTTNAVSISQNKATPEACRALVTFSSGRVSSVAYDAQSDALLAQTVNCARLVSRC